MPTLHPIGESSELYAAAYAQLQSLARRERRRAGNPGTINTTALVHETWFKLRSSPAAAGLPQKDFLAIAAHAMRQVLIDHARRLGADKRQHVVVTLGHADEVTAPVPMFEIADALCQLDSADAQLARIVDLHVFAGLEFREIAESEGISERSVFRLWRNARVFLLDQLAP